jgi:Mrp family chromosome partitioning ATPase
MEERENMHASEQIEDQATGLRRMINPEPVRVIAVTGGKGGVGKTNVSVNLGVAMAELGRRVMLLDADLGLANIDVVLGLHASRNLSHVMSGECSLEEVIVEGPKGMRVVPGASGLQRMAELSPAEHAGLIHGGQLQPGGSGTDRGGLRRARIYYRCLRHHQTAQSGAWSWPFPHSSQYGEERAGREGSL